MFFLIIYNQILNISPVKIESRYNNRYVDFVHTASACWQCTPETGNLALCLGCREFSTNAAT